MAHDEELELRAAREARLAELEARARRPRGLGVRPAVALTGLLLCVVLLWLQRRDIAYLFAPREPVTLGSEGAYRLDRLESNRYAQIHGRPTPRAAYGMRDGEVVVMVGVQETPVVVRRAPLPGEDWAPGRTPPPPHQSPFGVRGRLLREDEDPAFAEGFAALRTSELMRPQDGKLWVLVESERPGADRVTAFSLTALGALALLNVWLLVRTLRDRRQQRA